VCALLPVLLKVKNLGPVAQATQVGCKLKVTHQRQYGFDGVYLNWNTRGQHRTTI